MAAPGFNTPTSKKRAAPKKNPGGDPAYGMPRVGLHPETPGKCETPRCGAVADNLPESDLPNGWVRAGVHGSTDPDRVWCSGLCAMHGIAVAELRVPQAAHRA